jgi:hypothetical protein
MRSPYNVSINPGNFNYKKTWKQRFRDWLNDSGEDIVEQDSYAVAVMPSLSIDNDRGINFKVFKASGGTVIETSFYDRQKDRHHNSLHVITDDKDIGKELGKIITIETLKL